MVSRADDSARIEPRHDGFALRWPDPSAVAAYVGWGDVVRIRAHRRGLSFERGTGGPVQVHRGMAGFEALSASLRERFPGIRADGFDTDDAVVYESDGPWRVMQGELVSPSGRFEFELDVREVFNSHWAATPTLVDRQDRSAVFAFADSHWSCDRAQWDGDRVTLSLRKYPGNHTPGGIEATIDCPARTGAVGDGPQAPLAGLEAALDAALTFHWAKEPPEPPPKPLGRLLRRLLGR